MKDFLNEDGATAVIVAFSLTLMLTFCALVFDLGRVYLHIAEIQNAADAAAFAASDLLPVDDGDLDKEAKIETMAQDYAVKNGINASDVQAFTSGPVGSNTHDTVNVSISSSYNYDFARVIGKNSVTITRDASVSVGPVSGIQGAVPIGITEDTYDEAKSSGLKHVTLKCGGGDGTNGNYGFVVLEGKNASDTELMYWFVHGFGSTINVGQTFPTASGNKANIAKDGVSQRIQQCHHFPDLGGCTPDHYVMDCPRVVLCLVYTPLSDGTVKVTGFAPFIVDGFTNDGAIIGSYVSVYTNSGEIGKTAYDAGLYTKKLVK